MGIPVVTFFVFMLVSFSYYAVESARIYQVSENKAGSHSLFRFLPFILLFFGLFSSAWLIAAVTLPLAKHFSDTILPFSQTMHTFVSILFSCLLLFSMWFSFGYFLPKWLTKHYPQLIKHRLPSSLFPVSYTNTGIGEIKQSGEHLQESQNIIEFSRSDVSEIATHRTDVTALQIDATLEEVFLVIQDTEFTRIPVYTDDIDHMAGILHVKDFFRHVKSHTSAAFFSLHHLIRPVTYVRMNQEMDAVFQDMKDRDYSIAVVLDEFGGTHGLITLEDIIRDITKDLLGEHKPITADTKDIFPLSGNRYLVNGVTSLFILEGSLGIAFPTETPHHTLDNFLAELIDWQLENQKYTAYYKHLKFTVHSMKANQIESVIITVLDEQEMNQQFIG